MSTVRATVTAFVGHNGVTVALVEGDEYDHTHSLVQAQPQLFTGTGPGRDLTPGPVRAVETVGEIEDADLLADVQTDVPSGMTTVTGPPAKPRRQVKRRG